MRYLNILPKPDSKLLKFYFNSNEGGSVQDFKGTIVLT